MKKIIMSMIGLALITSVAIAADNKTNDKSKAKKQHCDTKLCKDKKACPKKCKPTVPANKC
jgi:hypothetical protein